MDVTDAFNEFPANLAELPLDVAKKTLEKTEKAHSCCSEGRNCLFYAVLRPDEDEACELSRLILEEEIVPRDHVDLYGQTALFYAAREGHLRCVEMLVQEFFFDVSHVDHNKQTALFYAARDGRTETLQFLVEHGADINHIDTNGDTPIFYAARDGRAETVHKMVEVGADCSIRNKKKAYASTIARKHGYKELAADLDARRKTQQQQSVAAAAKLNSEIETPTTGARGGRRRRPATRAAAARQKRPPPRETESPAPKRRLRRRTSYNAVSDSVSELEPESSASPIALAAATASEPRPFSSTTTAATAAPPSLPPSSVLSAAAATTADPLLSSPTALSAIGGGSSSGNHLTSTSPTPSPHTTSATPLVDVSSSSPVYQQASPISSPALVPPIDHRSSPLPSAACTTAPATMTPTTSSSAAAAGGAAAAAGEAVPVLSSASSPEPPRISYTLQFLGPDRLWTFATPAKVREFEALFPNLAVWNRSQALPEIGLDEDPFRAQWHQLALRLVNWMLEGSVEGSWLFAQPVNPKEWDITDYFRVVKKPMDFSTIRNFLLKETHYRTISSFWDDVQLVFYNCILYNSAKSNIGEVCLKVRKACAEYADQIGVTKILEEERIREAAAKNTADTILGPEPPPPPPPPPSSTVEKAAAAEEEVESNVTTTPSTPCSSQAPPPPVSSPEQQSPPPAVTPSSPQSEGATPVTPSPPQLPPPLEEEEKAVTSPPDSLPSEEMKVHQVEGPELLTMPPLQQEAAEGEAGMATEKEQSMEDGACGGEVLLEPASLLAEPSPQQPPEETLAAVVESGPPPMDEGEVVAPLPPPPPPPPTLLTAITKSEELVEECQDVMMTRSGDGVEGEEGEVGPGEEEETTSEIVVPLASSCSVIE